MYLGASSEPLFRPKEGGYYTFRPWRDCSTCNFHCSASGGLQKLSLTNKARFYPAIPAVHDYFSMFAEVINRAKIQNENIV
jgi:hypothetical protein